MSITYPMNKKCKKILPYLNAYLDGEVSERLRHTLDSHLATCESCRGRLDEIRGVARLFEDTLPVPPVPDRLAMQIMAEAQKRRSARVSKKHFPPLAWNPVQWSLELSASIRFAAFATLLLTFIAVLFFNVGNVTETGVNIEAGNDLYGIEWFSPTPPGSIGSIYLAMVDQPYERGYGQ